MVATLKKKSVRKSSKPFDASPSYPVKILARRTKKELGFDPTSLPYGDHSTVFMQCGNCKEEFIRPIRLMHMGHRCGTFNGWTMAQQPSLPRLECQKVHRKAKYPFRKRTTDAGHDISSIQNVTIPRLGMANVHTGIIIVAPEGWYYTVEARSSLWTKNIMPYRGIIDATYTGELMVAMLNSSEVDYKVKVGDRIAQIILHQVHDFDLAPVKKFSPEYNQRGMAGFGSSGK